MRERSEHIKVAREFLKEKSFVEWAREFYGYLSFGGQWRSFFVGLEDKATKLGLLLSLCLTEILFLACTRPQEGMVKLYRKYFKSVIKTLIECQGEAPSTVAMTKVVFVLEFAEKELVGMGVQKRKMVDDGREDLDPKGMSAVGAAVDELLGALLQQVLMLDALLSIPITASLGDPHDTLINKDLHDLPDSLNLGEKEIEKLSLRVKDLKAVQDKHVHFLMGQFNLVMVEKIVETWKCLEE